MQYTDLLKTNPNLIIYGKSGTGKTFAARKLVEDFEKKYFKEVDFASLEKQGRVKFISFHSSYTYQEFIERRISFANEEKIEEGILPEMANLASLEILKAEITKKIKNSINTTSKIWKVSLGYRKTEERIYRQCKKAKEIVIGWLENESLEGKSYNEIYAMMETKRGKDEPRLSNDVSSINALVNDMKKGDFVLIYSTPTTISDIGIVEGDYFHEYGEAYPHKRKVSWLREFNKPVDIANYDNKTRLCMKTIYELEQINFSALREIIAENQKKVSLVSTDNLKPYYLVIDNVDSVNLTEIFGETLILLEKNSRAIYKTKLLYSKKNFSLPENLYIIGTAKQVFSEPFLQRKFLFVQTHSDKSYLKDIFIKGEASHKSVNLADFYEKLNNQIAKYSDEKYQLGHTYFIDIKNIEELYNTFYFKIIPILQANQIPLKEIFGNNIFDAQNNIKYLSKDQFFDYLVYFISQI